MRHYYYLTLAVFMMQTGCSFRQNRVTQYTLETPQTTVADSGYYHNHSLLLLYPNSFDMKLNQKLYFSNAPYQLGVYQKAQWSNSLGNLLEAYLFKTLYHSKLFKSVIPYTSSAQSEYRLETRVLTFKHQVTEKSSYAHLSLHFTLISNITGKLVGQKRFSYKVPTQSTDVSGYIKAVNHGLKMLAADLTVWLSRPPSKLH